MLIVCSDMETLQKATHCKLMKQEVKPVQGLLHLPTTFSSLLY